MTKTYDVAICPACGNDPKMMEGGAGFAIVCNAPPCPRKPRVVRPRAGQAVKDWNALAGVPKIKRHDAPRPVSSSTPAVPLQPAAIIAPPLSLTFKQRWRWRLRRAGLRILWLVSRPGWRACETCPAEFTVTLNVYACKRCGLPYADAEAEGMIRKGKP